MDRTEELSSGMHIVPVERPMVCRFLDLDFPTVVATWNERPAQTPAAGVTFGFVYRGPAVLRCKSGEFSVSAGMYFSIPGSATISGGCGFLCTQPRGQALFALGGPIESLGRLKYIDGCSDTLLFSPVLLGEPCFNFLNIPPGIDQTAHTHPSIRVGMVVEGHGHCITNQGRIELTPGYVFILHPDEIHSFHTSNEALRLVVYHPDSDFGPTHDNHPMLNRTIVDKVSAARMETIRTKEIVAEPNFRVAKTLVDQPGSDRPA